MKKKLIVFFLFCSMVVLNSIEPKDYQSMTDHDRISLAVSYYEVFLNWKGKKNNEAENYLKEAYKIEPEVDKYYRGELEIPEKTISFDWDEIFPEEENGDDFENEYIGSNDATNNDAAWAEIVKIINGQKFENLNVYFNDTIDIIGADLRITRDELSETLREWFSMGNAAFPEYTTSFVNENVLKVTLKSAVENFFLPITGDTFYVLFLNGLVAGFCESL